MATAQVAHALKIILDPGHSPLCIADGDGTSHTTLVVACLRKLQGWHMDAILDEISRCVAIEPLSANTTQLSAKLPRSPTRILHHLLLRPLIQCRTVHTPTAALPRMALAFTAAVPTPSQTPRQILHPGHAPVFQSPPLPSSLDCEETPNYADRLSASIPVAISISISIPISIACTAAAAYCPYAQQPRTSICIGIYTRIL